MRILKKRNIKNLYFGIFFYSLSGMLVSFFLPFFLKQEGLNILEIGVLFTIGIAVGDLVMSLFFANIQKKIKLKTGLYISAFFSFFYSFILYLFPTSIGIIASKISGEVGDITSKISLDVTSQHNIHKKKHLDVSYFLLIITSFAMLIGLFLAVLLIKIVGFTFSFLIFALLAIPSFFYYKQIDERTRFKPKPRFSNLKLGENLKLIIASEMLYRLALGTSFALVVTFLITDKYSAGINWIAYLFGGLYLSILLSTFFVRKRVENYNLIKSSIIGMFILFLSAVAVIISTNIYFVLGAMVLEGIGASVWDPAARALCWKNTPEEIREKTSGYSMGIRKLVTAIGPLLGGFLVAYLGILAPFYFKAVIALGSIGIYFYLLKITR